MNALRVINPYNHLGMWVFDDESTGLVREPFVAGADLIIERVVTGNGPIEAIPDAEEGFRLVFGDEPFPRLAGVARVPAAGVQRQLVLLPRARHGGLALPGALSLLPLSAGEAVLPVRRTRIRRAAAGAARRYRRAHHTRRFVDDQQCKGRKAPRQGRVGSGRPLYLHKPGRSRVEKEWNRPRRCLPERVGGGLRRSLCETETLVSKG